MPGMVFLPGVPGTLLIEKHDPPIFQAHGNWRYDSGNQPYSTSVGRQYRRFFLHKAGKDEYQIRAIYTLKA
jgi:hypothetical protein